MRPGLRWVLGALGLLVACGPGDGDTGGVSSGSSGSGTSGTSGSTGEPTTGGTTSEPVLAAECEVASDCVVVNNCCECSARPADAEVAACEDDCLQSTCDAELRRDIAASCRMGRCVFAEVVCDGAVTCDEIQPICPEGTQISVKDSCWGPCVEPRDCISNGCPLAGGCGEGWTCVSHQASGLQCVPIPNECGGVADCECFAPYMDEFCPAACSDDGMGALLCEDGG